MRVSGCFSVCDLLRGAAAVVLGGLRLMGGLVGGICFACVILVGFKFASLWEFVYGIDDLPAFSFAAAGHGLESFVFALGCCLDVAGLDLSLVVVVWLL